VQQSCSSLLNVQGELLLLLGRPAVLICLARQDIVCGHSHRQLFWLADGQMKRQQPWTMVRTSS